MAKVGIVMGSDSDMKVMGKAADMLEKFGIDYEMTIISAHREPDVFYEYAKSAEAKDFKVIIAGAGMAAHLPGMCAAIFPMPVIGIPMSGKNLEGSTHSIQSFRCRPESRLPQLRSMAEQTQLFWLQRFLQPQILSFFRN